MARSSSTRRTPSVCCASAAAAFPSDVSKKARASKNCTKLTNSPRRIAALCSMLSRPRNSRNWSSSAGKHFERPRRTAAGRSSSGTSAPRDEPSRPSNSARQSSANEGASSGTFTFIGRKATTSPSLAASACRDLRSCSAPSKPVVLRCGVARPGVARSSLGRLRRAITRAKRAKCTTSSSKMLLLFLSPQKRAVKRWHSVRVMGRSHSSPSSARSGNTSCASRTPCSVGSSFWQADEQTSTKRSLMMSALK
mmetsp:Transcript_74492/g.232298  ORF Transcript_74492/g.232298 Transcript_74492/m.232298 type:complete len:252 (-) Transcript_74492:470-1225(-)